MNTQHTESNLPTGVTLIELTNRQLTDWKAVKQDLLAAGAPAEQVAYCQERIEQLLAELARLSGWRS